jgi:mannose/cellobiose epimerase-like protein (N-acyl-D-glucosamine 2-epimerase family)
MMENLSNKLNWFREHLVSDILPRWLTHSETESGLFFPHFGRTWERQTRDICTLVSQTRLLYNFSIGYRVTRQAEYLEAVNHGADALLRHFRDPEYGGWHYSCNFNGRMVDSYKDLYGHAFAIFGLTNAAAVTEREDLKREAFGTWDTVRSCFRDASDGFAGRLTRSFDPLPEADAPTPSQNPIMHLFEALLTLDSLDDTGRARQDAEEVAGFVLNRLRRKSDGILPELFQVDWNELSAENGGRIDIGHAFEWSYLMSRAGERWHVVSAQRSGDYVEAAQRFLEYGLDLGFDPTDGGIISPVRPDGTYKAPIKGWWEQCEAIRALIHFAVARGYEQAWKPLQKVIAFVQSNFVDSEHGGWFMRPPVSAGEDRACLDKGSQWKVDYHVVGMCAEAIRLAD